MPAAVEASARLVAIAGASVGVVVAIAPEIPSAIRHHVLVLSLATWIATVLMAVVQCVRTAWLAPGARSSISATVVGIVGVGVAVLTASQLEIVRVAFERPGLVWNVDWRWTWNHAQAVARFGGVEHALDYAGVPVDYHVGPAWLAAAASRTLGSGMTEVLFGVVPSLSVLSAAIGVFLLIGGGGRSPGVAAAALGVAVCMPAGTNVSIRSVLQGSGIQPTLLNADTWFFASGLMLNSYMGIGLGLCSLALLLRQRRWTFEILLGAAGLAALVQIKPQFFIAFGAVAGVVGVGRALGVGPFFPRSFSLLIGAAFAVGLAVCARAALPGSPPGFASFVWAPGETGYSLQMAARELRTIPFALAALGFSGWAVMKWRTRLATVVPPPEIFVGALVAFLLVTGMLTVIGLPLKEGLVTQARAMGLPMWANFHQVANMTQAFVPLRLLLVIGGLFILSSLEWRPWLQLPAAIIAVVIIALPTPLIVRNFVDPEQAYEAAEDEALLGLVREIRQDQEIVIASDLADSAQSYSRPLRAVALTAYGGNMFYISNLAYYHNTRADAPMRLEALRAFFGAAWSNWHGAWLTRTGITHILVNTRCVPLWWRQPDVSLRVAGEAGAWTLLEPSGEHVEHAGAMPHWEVVSPRYGQAPCL